jgi:23S rRNA pseudouridine1911/1915/1917 synthase
MDNIRKADKARLDVVLAAQIGEPRHQAQKMIKLGQVLVNGKVELKVNHRVNEGDAIKVTKAKPAIVKAKLEAALPEVSVIKETDDYLVINKPAGLMVHGARGNTGPTLVAWLIKNYPKIAKVGDDLERPGIVHRLDKDVSGLMVVAKNNKSFEDLKSQFSSRKIYKEYQGLVYGALTVEEGVLNFPLSRSTKGHKMAAHPFGTEGKEAITEFKVLKHFVNYSLLSLVIKTGRTHQIRAHLSAFNHQLVGDNLYGTNITKIKNKKFNLGRVWLVSVKLSFTDLAGEKQTFKIKIPAELQKFLKEIK